MCMCTVALRYSKYILTLLTYILTLLKPQMVHLLMPESVASMTYILALLLCVTKLTIVHSQRYKVG